MSRMTSRAIVASMSLALVATTAFLSPPAAAGVESGHSAHATRLRVTESVRSAMPGPPDHLNTKVSLGWDRCASDLGAPRVAIGRTPRDARPSAKTVAAREGQFDSAARQLPKTFDPNKVKPGSITVPVYVHIITAGRVGDVSTKRVEDQIRVLNLAYANKIKKNKGGVATPFKFQLRHIGRTSNSAWFTQAGQSATVERDMKRKLRRGGANALNVYTLKLPYLGIATFPNEYSDYPSADGVMIRPTTLPGPGSEKFYDLGMTLVHEVGHWLGLYHTFQQEACGGRGDRVSDTASESAATFKCIKGSDSCPGQPGRDNIETL